jgi:hypothetical protein
MLKFISSLIRVAALLLLAAPLTVSQASEDTSRIGTAWDSAVHSLLANGLYGFDGQREPELKLHIQHFENMFKGQSFDKPALNGQAITFSYEGSSGLLGFSAGYILTGKPDTQEPGTLLLDLEPSHSWYLAVDLSRSYQLDENFSLNLGNRTMLMKNPFDTEEGHVVSMLFNMPISYKNFLTISPEIQWTRPVSRINAAEGSPSHAVAGEPPLQDVFYGGLSVSFSY